MGVPTYYYRPQRSCGKVIFSQVSISHSVHGGRGVDLSMHWGRHSPGRHPPCRHLLPTTDVYCSGQYASYWNAFLFGQIFLQTVWKWIQMGRQGASEICLRKSAIVLAISCKYFSISIRITYAKPVPGWWLQYWRCIDCRHPRVLL